MKQLISRRLILAAAVASSVFSCSSALAQASFPSRPIKIVVPYPAGGATDILARMTAQKLQEAWGVTVMVENKTGASGTVGNNMVAKAPADGYTVLMAITAIIQQ